MKKKFFDYLVLTLGLTGVFFITAYISAQLINGLLEINLRDEGIALRRFL